MSKSVCPSNRANLTSVNLRYALGWCLFGYPGTNKSLSNSCTSTCSPLLPAITSDIANSSKTVLYGYCQDPSFEPNIDSCVMCYSGVSNQQYLANCASIIAFEMNTVCADLASVDLKVLRYACNSLPTTTSPFPIPSASIFTTRSLNESSATSSSPSASAAPAGLSPEARSALAISIPVAFFLVSSLLLVIWYVHRNTSSRPISRQHHPHPSHYDRPAKKPYRDQWSSGSTSPELEHGNYHESYAPRHPPTRAVPVPVRHLPPRVAVPPPVRTNRESLVPFSREHINLAGPLTPIYPDLGQHPAFRYDGPIPEVVVRPGSPRPRTRPPSNIPYLPQSRYRPPSPPRAPIIVNPESPATEPFEEEPVKEATRPPTPGPAEVSSALYPAPPQVASSTPTSKKAAPKVPTTTPQQSPPASSTKPLTTIISHEESPPASTKVSSSDPEKPETVASGQAEASAASENEKDETTALPKIEEFPRATKMSEKPAQPQQPSSSRNLLRAALAAFPEKTKQKLNKLNPLATTNTTSAPPPSPTGSDPEKTATTVTATSPLRTPPGLLSWDHIALQNEDRRRRMGPSPSPVSPLTVPTRLAGDDKRSRRRSREGNDDSRSHSRSAVSSPSLAESLRPSSRATNGAGPVPSISPVPSASSQPGSVRTPMRLGSPVLGTLSEEGRDDGHGRIHPSSRGHDRGQGHGPGGSGGGWSGRSITHPGGSGGGISGGSVGGISGGSAGRREVRRSREVDYER